MGWLRWLRVLLGLLLSLSLFPHRAQRGLRLRAFASALRDLDAPHQTSFQVKRSKNSKISASDVTIFRFSGFQVGAAEEKEKET